MSHDHAANIAALLDPDDWPSILAAAPERPVPDPDGQLLTNRGAVVHAADWC